MTALVTGGTKGIGFVFQHHFPSHLSCITRNNNNKKNLYFAYIIIIFDESLDMLYQRNSLGLGQKYIRVQGTNHTLTSADENGRRRALMSQGHSVTYPPVPIEGN